MILLTFIINILAFYLLWQAPEDVGEDGLHDEAESDLKTACHVVFILFEQTCIICLPEVAKDVPEDDGDKVGNESAKVNRDHTLWHHLAQFFLPFDLTIETLNRYHHEASRDDKERTDCVIESLHLPTNPRLNLLAFVDSNT